MSIDFGFFRLKRGSCTGTTGTYILVLYVHKTTDDGVAGEWKILEIQPQSKGLADSVVVPPINSHPIHY